MSITDKRKRILQDIKDKLPASLTANVSFFGLGKKLSPFTDNIRKSFNEYYLLAKEKAAPLISYYNSLNPREKLLSKLAVLSIAGYATLYIVIFPYLDFRNSVVDSRDRAYEEFTWLSQQRTRVSDIVAVRGGDFNQVFSINDVIGSYAPTAKAEQLADGEYLITMTAGKGTAFFNLIHAIINRGGELLSVQLTREDKRSTTNYEARIKI